MERNLVICTINEGFINYLFTYDKRVLFNKKEKRPYVGILFDLEGVYYFAPLSSPKPKHLTIKDSALDCVRMEEGKLGIINLNNMIPISLGQHEIFDIDKEPDKFYKTLLKKQFLFLNKNSEYIIRKAKRLYNLYKNGHLPEALRHRCCNFLELEKRCKEFPSGEAQNT
jgi:protein AbiQ